MAEGRNWPARMAEPPVMHSPGRTLEAAALPPGLRDLPRPPRRLCVHGELPRGPRIAIVGTRRPTSGAAEYAHQLACRLAAEGVAILSGGAAGIDAAAHRGALAARGKTVVVAPSSYEHPYPAEHAELYRQIVESGGAYVSPFGAGVLARRHQFFARNSYLVALAQAVVVVEAPLRRGARNAAQWARRLGRQCFVVPAAPWNPIGLGCIEELRLGARPLVSADEVLRWLADQQFHAVPLPGPAPISGAAAPRVSVGGAHLESEDKIAAAHAPQAGATTKRVRARRERAAAFAVPPSLTSTEQALLAALRQGARHPDDIVATAALSAAEVSHAIVLLTLKGLVVQPAPGEIVIAE